MRYGEARAGLAWMCYGQKREDSYMCGLVEVGRAGEAVEVKEFRWRAQRAQACFLNIERNTKRTSASES